MSALTGGLTECSVAITAAETLEFAVDGVNVVLHEVLAAKGFGAEVAGNT